MQQLSDILNSRAAGTRIEDSFGGPGEGHTFTINVSYEVRVTLKTSRGGAGHDVHTPTTIPLAALAFGVV
jgi:hypothetical protein